MLLCQNRRQNNAFKYPMQNSQEIEQDNSPQQVDKSIPTDNLLDEFERIIESFHNLPKHAQFSFVTHADLHYCLKQVINILKADVNGKL